MLLSDGHRRKEEAAALQQPCHMENARVYCCQGIHTCHMTFAAILWISNFIGSARILAKNRDDLQKAGYSHHTYFFPSSLQKNTYGLRN